MQQLNIKNVSVAVRCEICHQTDCFEPISGICQRCQSLPAELIDEQITEDGSIAPANSGMRDIGLRGIVAGASLGLLIGTIANLQSTIDWPRLVNVCFALMIFGSLFGAIIEGGIYQIREQIRGNNIDANNQVDVINSTIIESSLIERE